MWRGESIVSLSDEGDYCILSKIKRITTVYCNCVIYGTDYFLNNSAKSACCLQFNAAGDS